MTHGENWALAKSHVISNNSTALHTENLLQHNSHLDWLLTNGRQPRPVSAPPPQTISLITAVIIIIVIIISINNATSSALNWCRVTQLIKTGSHSTAKGKKDRARPCKRWSDITDWTEWHHWLDWIDFCGSKRTSTRQTPVEKTYSWRQQSIGHGMKRQREHLHLAPTVYRSRDEETETLWVN